MRCSCVQTSSKISRDLRPMLTGLRSSSVKPSGRVWFRISRDLRPRMIGLMSSSVKPSGRFCLGLRRRRRLGAAAPPSGAAPPGPSALEEDGPSLRVTLRTTRDPRPRGWLSDWLLHARKGCVCCCCDPRRKLAEGAVEGPSLPAVLGSIPAARRPWRSSVRCSGLPVVAQLLTTPSRWLVACPCAWAGQSLSDQRRHCRLRVLFCPLLPFSLFLRSTLGPSAFHGACGGKMWGRGGACRSFSPKRAGKPT